MSLKSSTLYLSTSMKKFALQPFKNIAEFELEAEGMLVPYQFVQFVGEEDQPNMEVKVVNFKGVKIPVLTNCTTVPENTMLTRPMEIGHAGAAAPSEPEPKRRKKHI